MAPLDERLRTVAALSPIDRPPRSGPLPTGTLYVGAGLCVLGVTVYAFLSLSARALGPDRYSALSALWVLVFLAGPGVFFPVEQEVSRLVASRRSAGIGVGPVVRRAGLAAVVLAACLALIVAGLSGPLLHQVFDDQALVLFSFGTSVFTYAGVHVVRGVLSGSDRFGPYSVLLGAEGAIRLVVTAALLVLGVRTAGPIALVVALAPLAAVALALTHERGLLDPGPAVPWAELSRSLGFLVIGSLLAQVLIHSGPLVVKLLAGNTSKATTARFFTGVLLTRMPLFLFFAVQAALLPRLAAFAAARDRAGFSDTLRRLLMTVGALGIASVAGAFFLGQLALEVLFGPKFLLDSRGLALLAASSAAIMLALALGQGLLALDGQARAASCWLAGVLVFIAVTAIGHDPLLRVELGLVAGSSTAAGAMACILFRRLHRMLPLGDREACRPQPSATGQPGSRSGW